MGETYENSFKYSARIPFSILERIVMGETARQTSITLVGSRFQYPRTDRDG